MEVKLITLSENTAAGPGFISEWGLSILVQVNELNVLFDTGLSFAAVRNADKLGVDFRSIHKIILSHGHADHTGGLQEVLRRTGKVEVVAHPAIWVPKYKTDSSGKNAVYNGIPFARDELENLVSFELSNGPVQISKELMTTGEVPITTDFENIEANYWVKKTGTLQHDSMPDDLALIAKMEKGLLIVLGCAHRGIINTIRHAQKLTGEKRVYAVVGGTHLYPKSDVQIEKTIQALLEIGVQKIGVSHCTGLYASMQLAQAFGDQFFFNNAGSVFTMD